MRYIFTTISILFFTSGLFANSSEYEAFSKQQNEEFNQFQKSFEKEYEDYKNAFEDSFLEYKKSITEKWPEVDTTNKTKWVEYNEEYSTKKVVDFENEKIFLEVFAKDEDEAFKKFSTLMDEMSKDDVKSAYKNDQLQQMVDKKLNKKRTITDNKAIISDVMSKKELKESLKKAPIKKISYKNNFIFKVELKLPSNSTLKKASSYKKDILRNSNKRSIPPELVFAIMHSESSFNPMARSHIPAFGLMQIVPKSAGVDSYNFLYGKKKLLSAKYLYNSSNNIKIGTAYLHILYFKYLLDIENPISRFYCTIAAYNTGAGNVAKSFVGSYNIKKASKVINKMSSKQVYSHLYSSLPYDETKKYLRKVSSRVEIYRKLLKTGI